VSEALRTDLRLPTSFAPKSIAAAFEARAERQADYARARAELEACRAGLAEAKRLDVAATADARDAGRPDPEREHERRAQAAYDEAERSLEAERLRLERAHAALLEAIEQNAEGWRSRAETEVEKAERDARKGLGALEDAYERRHLAHVVTNWLAAVGEGRGIERLLRKGATAPTSTVELSSPNREPYSIGAVLHALRADLDETHERTPVVAAEPAQM
jgi:multidrug efflux pump subunit AcrA (membrane-fusion protein)